MLPPDLVAEGHAAVGVEQVGVVVVDQVGEQSNHSICQLGIVAVPALSPGPEGGW